MDSIDIAKLKQLRKQSGISFSLCKKALEESNNDIERAKKKLVEWGAEKVDQKSDRSTQQGALFSYVHHNNKIASLVEVRCETDFVAGNNEFQKFGQELAMQAASISAKNVDEFLTQEYIRDSSKKINAFVKETIAKFGENIKVTRVLRWTLGEDG